MPRMEPLSAPRSSPSSAVIGSVKMSSTTRRCVTSDASSSCRTCCGSAAHLLHSLSRLLAVVNSTARRTTRSMASSFSLPVAIDPIEQLDGSSTWAALSGPSSSTALR